MQFSSVILLLTAAMVMASRPAVRKRDGCTPNKLEAFHLGHGHDINSGDVKVKEGSIEHLGLKVGGGSGCTPDWTKVTPYNEAKGKGKGKGADGAKSAQGQYKV